MKYYTLFIYIAAVLMSGCGGDTPPSTADDATSSLATSASSVSSPASGDETSSVSSSSLSISSDSSSSASAPSSRLRIVSTPNPSLFPMLVALAVDPDLPVDIVPVTGSTTIDTNLSAGLGDALLSMTFVAARKSETGSVPPLRLLSVTYFSGFMLLTPQQDGITQIGDLLGKNILISGPIGSGKGGGPDIFFQAFLAQSGLGIEDFQIHYLPLNEGVNAVVNQTPLDDGDGDASNDVPADAYLLVEPAATGMVMNTRLTDTAMEKGLNCQRAFTKAASWEETALPLGGLSILQSISDDPANAALIATVTEAYNRGAETLMNATAAQRVTYANAIADGITTYFGDYDVAVPAAVIIAALNSGDLVYRYDIDMAAIHEDLDTFITAVAGTPIDAAFYFGQ